MAGCVGAMCASPLVPAGFVWGRILYRLPDGFVLGRILCPPPPIVYVMSFSKVYRDSKIHKGHCPVWMKVLAEGKSPKCFEELYEMSHSLGPRVINVTTG